MESLAMLIQEQEWQGAGHSAEAFTASWGAMQWIGLAGTFLLTVGLLALILIALRRNPRYQAVGAVSESELAEVKDAITKAEQETTGEVMVVLLERSDRHPAAHWLAAISMLFVGSLLLAGWLPWDQPALLLLAQLGLAAVGFALTRALPDLHNRFISPARAGEMVDEQAIQEFHRLELRETKGGTGVLLMVSLLEHRVVVLADKGIDSKVDADTWTQVQQGILDHIRAGHMGRGLLEGVHTCGAILAKHFPGEGGAEDLPNVVEVRSE